MRREMAAQSEALLTGGVEKQSTSQHLFIEQLKTMPIAINQPDANKQHYEVPTELYQACLGPWLKYSSGLWPHADTTFEQSEVEMLELYCQRAELTALDEGFKLFDLGCGWGSVTLYMATKYPKCTVVSLSNSSTQRKYILDTAKARGLTNVTVYTGDINEWIMPEEHVGTFDRCISIEMFEHMKNYDKLLGKVSDWLKPQGKLFVHIFTHTVCPYHFEKGWMAENFFTGGTMPSDSLLLNFQNNLTIDAHWRVSGEHYQKTSEAWLKRLDAHKTALLPVLAKTYGQGEELKWFMNWRLFYLACAELFGFRGGNEWVVSHYRFVKLRE
uniref:Methyltransferase domain-containing protein n=1 Tax=Octactis speculum TaxID=3111310 RepID=A0A7S2BPY3_9STRA